MNSEARQSRDLLAIAYLHQLQGLALELNSAMGAVASNSLFHFQESVSRQEVLCASLQKMARTMGDEPAREDPALNDPALNDPTLDEQPGPANFDSALSAKLDAAKGAVRDLNLQYAALLKHSGKSVALLASLCRNHAGQFQEARGSRSKQQTWSCEM